MVHARRVRIAVMVALATVSAASSGRAASGLASIDAIEKLQLKGCGKLNGNLSLDVQLVDSGAWSISAEAANYAGTYVAGGKGGRTLTLSVVAGSLAALEAGLRDEAATVCAGPVDSAVITLKTARVKLDKAGTTASLLLVASLSGDGNPLKKGKYRLKGKGQLGPLPTTTTTSTSTSTTTSTVSTTTTTVLVSTTTVTVTSSTTSTSIVPTGYGDCVNGGPGACTPTESCLTGVFNGETIGLCTTPCQVVDECPPSGSGNAHLSCDSSAQTCLLFCNAGETCPDGMVCVDGMICLFTGPCTPNCTGRTCGDDGCGTSCGDCADGTVCLDGQCLAGDTCAGRCGSYDSAASCQCDELCPGALDCCPDICTAGVCDGLGICSCVPDCTGRVCGFDGCFGTCGDCLADEVCTASGQCASGESCVGRCETFDDAAACQCDGDCFTFGDCCLDLCDVGVCDTFNVCTCVPDCTERICGFDGCFGSCGECLAGDICTGAGQCVSGSSCAGRCDTFDPAATCRCDPDCISDGECCPDICDPGVCDGLPLCVAPPG